MAVFCGNCGAPVGEPSGFCGSCGAKAGQAPAAQAAPAALAAPPAAAGVSALKIALIVVGVLFVLGAASIIAMYYTAQRYVAMAEEATGIKVSDVTHSVRDAAKRGARQASSEHRDGCLLLSKDEASSILGIQVERVDGKPNAERSGEYCSFFVQPGAIAEHEKSHPATAPEADKPMQDRLDEIKLRARSAVETDRRGDTPYFTFTVEREDGKISCAGLGLANTLSGGEAIAAASGKAAEPLGVGDQSVMSIGESMMCVVKGDSAFTLELNQIAGARAIGIAVAQKILSRL